MAATQQEIDRMHILINQINAANAIYYGKGGEPMSNFEWDKLYDELVALEEKTGIIMTNSPTINVGGESEDQENATFEKMEHEISVKSLDKTKDVDVLEAFLGSRPGIMSWKLDGLTIVLTYDGGELIKAVTRGKNGIGELVTENVRNFIAGVPVAIPYKGRLHTRGEAIITYKDFDIVNASLPEGEEPYKNPRNLAAGSVRQSNSTEVKNRRLNFIAFSSDHEEKTHSEEFKWLESQGFLVVPHMVVNSDEAIQIVVNERWAADIKKAWDVPYAVEIFRGMMPENPIPTDGLVLQFNETAYGKSLGETDKFPRDAIAFKWQDEEKETIVTEIHWSPSRTGLINPVAVFEPVELEGTTVERASVHNVSILEQLSITPGDTITVYKANMIIPQVSGNNTMLGKPVIPNTCPACGGKTEIRIGKENSRVLFCPNPECSAKHIKHFVHAVKQDALDIAGVSESTIKDFIDAGFLHTLPDLFRLERYSQQIAGMKGYGQKSMENICDAVEKARQTNLQKLIYACGIKNVGRTASKAICKHFDYDAIKTLNASKQELMTIEDIGDEIAGSYIEWFANPLNQEMFEDLMSQVELSVPETKVAQAAEGKPGITGLTLVVTGSVQRFPERNSLKAWVEMHGAKLVGSVSKNTDFLVTNTPNSGSSKNKKAQELGIPIITEQELIEMVE